jgi:copper chaperone CopZ
MKRLILLPGLLVGLLFLTGLTSEAQAQKTLENPDIVVAVDGLACPFCAYGLEKKLKNLDGVTEVAVLLDEGETQLKVEEGTKLAEETIHKTVENAGFTATKVTYANKAVRASSEPTESG